MLSRDASIYIDSRMKHASVSTGQTSGTVLNICWSPHAVHFRALYELALGGGDARASRGPIPAKWTQDNSTHASFPSHRRCATRPHRPRRVPGTRGRTPLGIAARGRGCGAELVVFPELALTTFFPRWYPELTARSTRTSRPRCRARLRARCSKPRPNLAWPSISATPRRDRLVGTLAAHVHRMSAGEPRLARLGRARNAVGDVDHDIPDDKDAHSTLRTSEPRHDRAASPRCPPPGLLPLS